MTSNTKRKCIIPKLNLKTLSQHPDSLTSRETSALISNRRETEAHRAGTFSSNRYNSNRAELWSSSMFTARKNKTYEEYQDEMYTKIWKDSEQELSKHVSELTLQLDELRDGLSSGKLTFDDAGILLSKIRRQQREPHHNDNDDDDDLILCLDLVEKLWECVNSDGLSCAEFSALLSNMLGRPKHDFDVLFQKMDADGDETLSWGEYVSFLSQQQAHLWDQQESKNVSYFRENCSSVYSCNGNEMFDKICIIKGEVTPKCILNGAKYAMLASDNSIQVRNAMTLALESSIDMNLRPKKIESDKYKAMRNRAVQQDANTYKHVTTCTNICSINKSPEDSITRLAVSFMDRSVNIYSPTFNAPKDMAPIYLQSPIDRKKYNNKIHYQLDHGFFALDIPQCMELFSDQDGSILVGETYGTIALYNYRDHNCLIRVQTHGLHSSGPCVVKQVKKVPRIGIVSTGMDNLVIVTDECKWSTVRTLTGHTRGVYCIAFSLSNRMLVSAGYDRKIIVWDPYVTKPLGLLKGHVSSVVGVLINEESNQIITASADKKIKIWDVRTWKCLQTIRDNSIHSPINQLMSIQYDPFQRCLITAGSKIRKWFLQNSNPKANINNKHDLKLQTKDIRLAPIIAVCYSNIFKQIISIHVDETCILWDVQSGQNSFEFKMNCNGDSITTAAIDEVGKRLLTATQNGAIKMWNFNNGAVMHEFDNIDFEVTQLIYLPRTLHCVVACGYHSVVNRFPSHLAPPEANFILQNKLHKTDVRAMCITTESLLTGSSDGMIVQWHIDSNVRSQVFHCKAPYVSITAMSVAQLNAKWHLFVGTEGGVVHIFEKEDQFVYIASIKDEYMFKEPILHIAINTIKFRLMIADCDVTMKLFDIKNLHKADRDYILIKEWEPHKEGCITSLLYIPEFDVFCSSSDNGEIVLWNVDGIFLGQFGSQITPSWNLFVSHSSSHSNNTNNKVTNDDDDQIHQKNKENSHCTVTDRECLQHSNSPQTKRKSYFDDHTIYRPKFINTVVTESIARTLLEDKSQKKSEQKQNKTQFEQNLDKLMVELMKPKKRKRSGRRSSIFPQRKSRMKIDYY